MPLRRRTPLRASRSLTRSSTLARVGRRGRRLEAGDVRGLLEDYGYYDWRRRAGG